MGQDALKLLPAAITEETQTSALRPDRRKAGRPLGPATRGGPAALERRARGDRRSTRSRKAPGFAPRRDQKLSMGLTKAELIEKYRYKVRIIAVSTSRNLPHGVELDDLISVGYMGLMEAGDRFDPKRGVKFETFAALRIRGSILDELRNLDWLPRSARDRVNQIQSARENLKAETGQMPNATQMSERMEIPLQKLQELLRDLGSVKLVNLSDMPEGYEPEDASTDNAFEQVVRGEVKAVVARALTELDERQRCVLNCYYYRGLGLKEISQILEVTEARVSQIHQQAVRALREKMKTPHSSVENVFLSLMGD